MPSLFFEDVRIGMEWRTALRKPFTEEDVRAFEVLTDDQVHMYEASGKEPRMLVQGNFIVAASGGRLFEDPGHFKKTIVLQTEKLTLFKRPVFIGDRIYVVERVVELDGSVSESAGQVVLARTTFNQNDKLVLNTYRQTYLIRKRLSSA